MIKSRSNLLNHFFQAFRTVYEFALDVANSLNEEIFVEMTDALNLVISTDDKISSSELELWSNITYIKTANAVDKVRTDGTARIDDFYWDYSAKIMANERHEKDINYHWREILLRSKDEWCQAVWNPPTNQVCRIEYKIKYTAWIIKDDKKMDASEFKCLTWRVSRNLAYNTDPMKNTEYEMIRMLIRLDDIISSFTRLDLSDDDHHDWYLEGMAELGKSLQIMALQLPKDLITERLNPIADKLPDVSDLI